jgi:hypothetical protein
MVRFVLRVGRSWLVGVWLLAAGASRAQEPVRRELDLNQVVEQLFPAQPADFDYEAVLEVLYQLYQRPLDLNAATYDELAATYVLSEAQLQQFFAYRAAVGPLVSLYELQAIPGFDRLTIERLLPFVTVRAGTAPGTRPTHSLVLRYDQILETKRGYTPPTARSTSRYAGSPHRYFLRYRYQQPGALSLGLTMEKDPGEVLAWQPARYQYGADFVSWHAQVQNRGRLRNLIVGDYQLQIGQGLVLSSGFYLGKGAETVLTARRSHLGARAYTSAVETGFFRGVTATVSLSRNLDLTGFGSRQRLDANVIDERTVSSIQTSGLHRTVSERDDRRALLGQDAGLHLLYRPAGRSLQLGATVLQTTYDRRLQKADRLYNRYEFAGTRNTVLGVHGSWSVRNANTFWEVARSASGGVGAVAGTLLSLSRRWDAALVGRQYDRHFHSFYGNAFGEGTRNSNERGLYGGLKYTPSRHWQWSGYLDAFRFPAPRYLVDEPSGGWGYLVRSTHTPRKTTQWFGQAFGEQKARNVPSRLSRERFVTRTTRQGLTLGVDQTFAPGWSLSGRALYSRFRYGGFAPSQGLGFVADGSARRGRFSLSARVAYIQTDDYDSRLYAYERDMPYAFSVPAYYNEMIRSYALLSYRLSPHLDLWLRAARTSSLDQEALGSGLETIEGPRRTELKIQVRWRH